MRPRFHFSLRALLAVVTVAAIACSLGLRDRKARALRNLRGDWTVVRFESESELVNRKLVRNVSWDEDLVVIDLDGEVLRYRVVIDPLHRPHRIDAFYLTSDGLTSAKEPSGIDRFYGVYSLKKETLTLCLGERRPEALFESTGTGQLLLELRRVSHTPSVTVNQSQSAARTHP